MNVNPPPASILRRPAVAGLFYTDDARRLCADVTRMLGATPQALQPGYPKALIVPHAGFVYSGPTAAAAYARVRPARGIVKRVVLLGPCHRVAVRGMAIPSVTAFSTPMGLVPLDRAILDRLAALPDVVRSDEAHALEHSLEVQLPFLQEVLGSFTLVPIAVGMASTESVAKVIEAAWGGPETLIVISSDLSHYHPYDDARRIDAQTCASILAFDDTIDHEQACGATPIGGLLRRAAKQGLRIELVDACNSGDTAGPRDRVVGYASFALYEPDAATYGDEHGRELVRLARESIVSAITGAPVRESDHAWLDERRATFVTLKRGESLRGCIGSLEARRSLGEDVQANAVAAAFADPRFPAVRLSEMDELHVEVSVLSPASLIGFASHDDLLRQLVPGEDGVILQARGRRSTFLPQVWEMLPAREDFLAELKAKAGLPADFPTAECTVWRYAVRKWDEREVSAS